jgi:hypothetical protein
MATAARAPRQPPPPRADGSRGGGGSGGDDGRLAPRDTDALYVAKLTVSSFLGESK